MAVKKAVIIPIAVAIYPILLWLKYAYSIIASFE